MTNRIHLFVSQKLLDRLHEAMREDGITNRSAFIVSILASYLAERDAVKQRRNIEHYFAVGYKETDDDV
ncbi:MAG: hypothetical protein GTO60_16610 [Gammaproteobacteria bacterium]|nr:hypothetical protein [Gammaproteobacteria bacterium]